MKYLRRYCCVFLLCLLLFATFSISVSAESNITPSKLKYQMIYTTSNGWGLKLQGGSIYFSTTSLNEIAESTSTGNYGIPPSQTYNTCNAVLSISNYDDGEILLKKGANTDISLYNVLNRMGVNATTGFFYDDDELSFVKVLVLYMDGSAKTITENVNFSHSGGYYDVEFSFEPTKDVKTIEIHTKRIARISTAVDVQTQITYYSGMGAKKTTFQAVQSSEESGLLKGIIEWLKGIKDGITNLFDSIAELPSKLWQLISDGLKSLFVPSDEYIVSFKEDIDSMLAEKLGAVYQVIDILANSWDRIQANDESNTINLPKVTIDLPQNEKFSFGGYDVAIVPNGFEWLATTIKTLVGIVCTILAINGFRKKYDEVMGVEQ